MKKRISTFLLALLAALTLTVPAWAETQPGDALIYDTESLLTDGERQQLESLADQITWQYDCAVYVVTIYDYEQYADGVYEAACTIYNDYDFGIGEDRDGVLLLLSMYDRSYSLYVRDGYAQSMIGSYAQQQLEDSFLDYLGDDDWYGGFHAYLTTCADMMQQASEGHAVRKPLGKVIFGIGCGLFTMLIRIFASYPEGVSFAILLMNILTPYIDKICEKRMYKLPKKAKEGEK